MENKQFNKMFNEWASNAAPIGDKLAGNSDKPWPVIRKNYMKALQEIFPAPAGLEVSFQNLNGIRTMIITPPAVQDDRTILFIHGGGYIHGGVEGYRSLAGKYAIELRAKVYLPDYRQAPEYKVPAPIEDVFAVYQYLNDQHINPQHIALVGDSAGGAMVVTVMRWIKNHGLSQPAAGSALSPWPNLMNDGETMYSRDGLDPVASRTFLNRMARAFLGSEVATDPDASPVYADVRGLAPVMIQTGENEVMMSDAVRLASHLAKNRVRVSLEVWPHMFHVWHQFYSVLPEAAQALQNSVNFINTEMNK
jgi:monoterpene epsilon-lactone hydrolase